MAKNLFTVLVCLAAPIALGETIVVESTGHYVPLNEPDWVDLGDGQEAYPGYQRHITAIASDGKIESHWCNGTNIVSREPEFEFEFGAGYCTVLDEDGDAYWTWFEVDGLGAFEWKVMGGTGKYEGATGGGVSTAASSLPDGTAVFDIVGEIELAEDGE